MGTHTPGPWWWNEEEGTLEAGCPESVDDMPVIVLEIYDLGHNSAANIHLITAAPDLLAACEAAIRYDAAIASCANDPDKMASYCTAQGEDLDALYDDWLNKARAAIAKARP